MAKGKKQDIGDIIRDVMGALTKPKRSGRAAKLQRKIPKPPNERTERPRKRSTRSGPQPMPRRAGDKPPSVQPMPRRAEFPEPMVEGQKRYPAYNVQPIRPRKNTRPPRQITDDAKRTMPKRKPKILGIPKSRNKTRPSSPYGKPARNKRTRPTTYGKAK